MNALVLFATFILNEKEGVGPSFSYLYGSFIALQHLLNNIKLFTFQIGNKVIATSILLSNSARFVFKVRSPSE